jgi:hypothetical protein
MSICSAAVSCAQLRLGLRTSKRTWSTNHIVEVSILNRLIRYNFVVYFIMERRTSPQLNGYSISRADSLVVGLWTMRCRPSHSKRNIAESTCLELFQAETLCKLSTKDSLYPIPSSGETFPSASRGVSHRQHSIKLYTFIYKFISNLYY